MLTRKAKKQYADVYYTLGESDDDDDVEEVVVSSGSEGASAASAHRHYRHKAFSATDCLEGLTTTVIKSHIRYSYDVPTYLPTYGFEY